MCNFQWENHFFPFSRYDKQKMTAQLILSIHFFISFFLFVRTPADHHLHLSHIIMQFVFDHQAYGVCARASAFASVWFFHLFICHPVHSHAFVDVQREPIHQTIHNAFRAFLLVFVFVFIHFYGFVLFDIKCINEST